MGVLEVLGIILASLVVLTLAALLATRQALRASNRVSRKAAVAAPTRWVFSVGRPARLHRRLRNAVRAVHPLRPRRRRRLHPAGTLAYIATEIEAHAIALDADLVAIAQLPSRHRGPPLAAITRQVAELEHLAARVAGAAFLRTSVPPLEPSADAVARMHETLDSLDAAHEELRRLEQPGRGIEFPDQS